MTHPYQRAFTLVELSIVLVILGLLIGGVLTGQSLIRAAELRSVSTQYGQYMTAVQTFRDKYFAIPGDMTNATAYWGAADGSTGMTAACATTASTTSATCNGNGNGSLQGPTGSNEFYRFWQHLANAGLIEGSYDGIAHGDPWFGTSPANSPKGKLSSSLWLAYNFSNQSGRLDLFDGTYDNSFEFGLSTMNADPSAPVVKPEEGYNVDIKVDDGKPATGKLVVRATSGLANCTDTGSSANLSANYLLSSTSLSCVLIFRQLF